MSQILTNCTGSAFLSPVSAACVVVLAPTGNIAAVDPSRALTIISPPEIFILRLLVVVAEELGSQLDASARHSPMQRLERSRFIPDHLFYFYSHPLCRSGTDRGKRRLGV